MVRDGNVHDPCTGNHVVIGHKEDIDERLGVTSDSGGISDGLEQIMRFYEVEEGFFQRVTSFNQVDVYITTNYNVIFA